MIVHRVSWKHEGRELSDTYKNKRLANEHAERLDARGFADVAVTAVDVDIAAREHVAALNARTEAFYAGKLSYESFGVKNRAHWEQIQGTTPRWEPVNPIESRVKALLRGEA